MAEGVTCLVAFGGIDGEVVCRLFRSREAGVAWCAENLSTLEFLAVPECNLGVCNAFMGWRVPHRLQEDSPQHRQLSRLFRRYSGRCGDVARLALIVVSFDQTFALWNLDCALE